MPPPFAGTMQKPAGPRSQPVKSKGVKRGFASLRERFSVRKRFRSDSSSPRRLQISGPTDFRHLHSESFQFPQYTTLQTVGHTMPPRPKRLSRTRPASFRPLELSIYVPKRELSPILPHFEMLTPPPPARVQPNPDDDVFGPSHEPSYSSMSFHLPRKISMSPSTLTMSPGDTPPKIPPKSRARSQTSSSVERMKERIAGAMLEVDKLQREIDLVMERQSIYVSSRPSTAHSMALTTHGKPGPWPKFSKSHGADQIRHGSHTHGPCAPTSRTLVCRTPEPWGRPPAHGAAPAADAHSPPRHGLRRCLSGLHHTTPEPRQRGPTATAAPAARSSPAAAQEEILLARVQLAVPWRCRRAAPSEYQSRFHH